MDWPEIAGLLSSHRFVFSEHNSGDCASPAFLDSASRSE
jgi:hypothetical protein